MSGWRWMKVWSGMAAAGIACAGGGFLQASKVTNPCIGRPVTETIPPRIAASLAGRAAFGEVVFEGFWEGTDGRVRWKDGCGNQTEDPLPLGEISPSYWIQTPGGARVEGGRVGVTRPGVYTGFYNVSSASGAQAVAQFSVSVPSPDWDWLQAPQVQITPVQSIPAVVLAPYAAFYPLASTLIPGVRYDRNGIFPNEAYPGESQFRISHRWTLRQNQRTFDGVRWMQVASRPGLSVEADITESGKLSVQVDTVVETSEPAWHQQYQNDLPLSEVSPVEVTIRGTTALEDDVVPVSRELNGMWLAKDSAQITVRIPPGLAAGPLVVEAAMEPGSLGAMRFEPVSNPGDSQREATLRAWATKAGFPGVPDRIAITVANGNMRTTVYKDVTLLAMAVNSEEFVTLCGHPGDNVELCHVRGIPCAWRMADSFMAIGLLVNPTDSRCTFVPRFEGTNRVQMWIGQSLIWEKRIDVKRVISREEWGAVAPKPHTETIGGFQHLTLHHSSNTASGLSEMRRIQRIHMSLFPYNFFGGKDFYDIGYHFVVDKTGRLYEGRRLESSPGSPSGPFAKGEHVGSNNTVAGLGVCIMGDFEATEGNEQLEYWPQVAIQRTVAALCLRYRIAPRQISYHRVLSVGSPSLCPGSNFIPKIPEIIQRVSYSIQ